MTKFFTTATAFGGIAAITFASYVGTYIQEALTALGQ